MNVRAGSIAAFHLGKNVSLYSGDTTHWGKLVGVSFPPNRSTRVIIHLAHMGGFEVSADHEIVLL